MKSPNSKTSLAADGGRISRRVVRWWASLTFVLRWMKWSWEASGIGVNARRQGWGTDSIAIIRKRWHENNPEPKRSPRTPQRTNPEKETTMSKTTTMDKDGPGDAAYSALGELVHDVGPAELALYGVPLEPSDVPDGSLLGKRDCNRRIDRIEPIISISVEGIEINKDFKEWDRLAYHGWLIKRPNEGWRLCRKLKNDDSSAGTAPESVEPKHT